MMDSSTKTVENEGAIKIELKDPPVAAVLAWLWPGAGHFYQGRHGKGLVFMICILGIFVFGMAIGGGRVVYASFIKADRRLPYLCQLGVGLPALPALVQAVRVHLLHRPEPLLNGFMAPPHDFRADGLDELASWHQKYAFRFELGTLFTMVAGLLNILAVYDAGCGPVFVPLSNKSDQPSDQKLNAKSPP